MTVSCCLVEPQNDAAAVSNAASSTALQSSRALEDAQASIAMLHARLEHAQAGTAQVGVVSLGMGWGHGIQRRMLDG